MRRIRTPKIKLPKLKAPRLNAPRLKMPKLSPPKITVPRLKGPKLRAPRVKAPGFKAPSIKAPQFLSNLYRDMRDRRLLLPALALAVALIVVPVALSSSPDTATPPAPSADPAGSDAEAATSPAVLAEQLGITDYRKRLEEFKSKDPFHSKFASTSPAEPSAATADDVSSGGATSTADTATTSGTSTASSSTTSPAGSSGGSSAAPSQPPEPPEPTLFAFRVDVAIGPPGDVTRRNHVQQGKFLPGDGKPMVAFAGATEDLKHALFLITDDVSSVTGDGRCVPGRNDCMLLRLAEGDDAKLAYAPEADRTYKLKLIGINLEPVDGGSADGSGKQASMSAIAAQG